MPPSVSNSEPRSDQLSLDVLWLDPKNPRLPEDIQGKSEHELLAYIADAFNPIEVARSIARYGFFPSEPLIAIEKDGGYTVVEGNRRLVALKVLADPVKAIGLEEEKQWRELAHKAPSLDLIPVIVARSREAVAPIIGYRHISGIQPWDPFAKARFIASLVDGGMSLEYVAEIVGESRTDVASHYRNHQIVTQARDRFRVDTRKIEEGFGVFTRAMSQTALRDYIGAPPPAQVMQGIMPIDESKGKEAEELFSWLFGDKKDRPVIRESRDIRQLGDVLKSTDGVAVLRTTRDLEEAKLAAGGPRNRLLTLLTRASSNLALAKHDISDYREEPEVERILEEIRERLEALLPATLHG